MKRDEDLFELNLWRSLCKEENQHSHSYLGGGDNQSAFKSTSLYLQCVCVAVDKCQLVKPIQSLCYHL